MIDIRFKIAAKTDVGLQRSNNEDNLQASADLCSQQMRWVNNEVYSLGEKGALLVVADGMGGMNAGEVASEIATQTVRECFATQNITPEVMKTRFSIEKFMNSVITAADENIKKEAKANPETRGMGTTIVIGWLLDGKLYISWCGDSRAYVYNQKTGLHQITKDHSYVQGLVDKGAITREDAFDYPESNIITNSLCDASIKARPESLLKPYDVANGDIILLCTDGLCGMIRDNEIEAVMRNNEHDMNVCADALIQAACDAEGADNITVCLCQILQGGGAVNANYFVDTEKRLNGKNRPAVKVSVDENNDDEEKDDKHVNWRLISMCLIAVIALGAVGSFFLFKNGFFTSNVENDTILKVDTIFVPASGNDVTGSEIQTTPEKDGSDSMQKEDKKKKPEGNKENVQKPAKDDKPEIKDNPEKDKKEPSQELTPIPVTDEWVMYEVQKGDSYSRLAKKFGTTKSELQRHNGKKELNVGDKILVPKN